VLEQGTLSGKYNTQHQLPEGSGRANTYNKVLPQLEDLTNAMKEIGSSRNASVAQVAIAWAIAKNTLPIIGVTKPSQIDDAQAAIKIKLSEDEIASLERLAAESGADVRGAWEKPMN
jgi:aryl-alcohol dehydrogenase-like predicted oxidoreductase